MLCGQMMGNLNACDNSKDQVGVEWRACGGDINSNLTLTQIFRFLFEL